MDMFIAFGVGDTHSRDALLATTRAGLDRVVSSTDGADDMTSPSNPTDQPKT